MPSQIDIPWDDQTKWGYQLPLTPVQHGTPLYDLEDGAQFHDADDYAYTKVAEGPVQGACVITNGEFFLQVDCTMRFLAGESPFRAMESIYVRYGDRCIAILTELRKILIDQGMFATEPLDDSNDEYRWTIGVWRTPEQGSPEDSIDVAITLEEAAEYGDDEHPFGMSWSLVASEYNGGIPAELRPYNYTPEVWIDGRDDQAVEERFKLIEDSDLDDIPRLLKEAR